MGLFRRQQPLHITLAREAGLDLGDGTAVVEPVKPSWDQPGVHGLQRAREWDVVSTVEAPQIPGDRASFVVLAPGRLIVLDGDDAVQTLATAVEQTLTAPFRAEAVRRGGGLWAVGAERIEVVELPDVEGTTIELAQHNGEQTFVVDGTPSIGTPPEPLVAAVGTGNRSVTAQRIDGDVFRVRVHRL